MARTIPELSDVIRRASEQYWKTGTSFLSDTAYDKAVEELRKLDPGNPILQQIEGMTPEQKVRHPVPMLSLQKAYSLDELNKWCRTLPQGTVLYAMPKYDGIAGRWDGRTLSTRGNGYEGENITRKLPIIRVPSAHRAGTILKLTECAPFLGEILMKSSTFNEFQREAEKLGITYKTVRNATAGLLNAKELPNELLWAMLDKGMYLHMVPYTGLQINTGAPISEKSFRAIRSRLSDCEYPMDGIVFRIADERLFKAQGVTAHHPKGAIAFKFQNESAETVLTGIEWSLGKECITPVALFEPVTIGDVTVSRASLHNMKNVQALDIQIGDTITVERAGDVIPYVADSVPGKTRTPSTCLKCPVCGAPTQYAEPELICSNETCPGKLVQCLLATARVFEVDSLAEKTIQKLVDAGYGNWLDILNMTKEDWLNIPGFADVSAENMVKELRKSTRTTPEAVLASLNIRGVGKAMAKLILSKVSLYELPDTRSTTLQGIPGIGPERAKAVEQYFGLQTHREYFKQLCDMLTIKYSAPTAEKTICFTGKMDQSRSYYENLAKEHGYTPVGSVTKALDVLVTTEMDRASSKMSKAQALGIRIMTLEDWLQSMV